MAKKQQKQEKEIVYAPIEYQPITETIEKNYMPYVMSVIVSRAIPEIDGLKPAHRKLLYTMYKMGLLSGARTKSANIVGQTMKLNPHGDQSIYETMVRLTRGNATLLHPLVDSKGSFGKQYSSDMKYAAARYTECKLDKICEELFSGIDKNAVEMIDNYDSTMKEPVLLPTTFPNILVMPNTGIAVGMATNICSFNLEEVCDGTIALLQNPEITIDELMGIIKAPDFSNGGQILYDREEMKKVFESGNGSVRLRAKYRYDKNENCIEILEIPYSTTIESILDKLTQLYKDGKLKNEVTDFRDEIDLSGFKLTLDLKKGADPDRLMKKLFKQTTLEDAFKCNFNVIIGGNAKSLGVKQILEEWVKFRVDCYKRELIFDLDEKRRKLHLLQGLGNILLDIDQAIRIIRKTEKDADVVPNLMKAFSLDEVQANFVADIKLRNINREFILNKMKEIEDLGKDIEDMENTLKSETKLKKKIIAQLNEIKKKYAQPRRSEILYDVDSDNEEIEEVIESYPCRFVMTREGYFKKITFASLRGNDIQFTKEGDEVLNIFDGNNTDKLIFVTNARNIYSAKADDFAQTKASVMGDYLPVKLKMDEGEKPVLMRIMNSYPQKDNFVFLFENGKGLKVSAKEYESLLTSGKRRFTTAYSKNSNLVACFYEKEPFEIYLETSDKRGCIIKSSLVPLDEVRTHGGVSLVTLKKNHVVFATDNPDKMPSDRNGLKHTKIPAPTSSIK